MLYLRQRAQWEIYLIRIFDLNVWALAQPWGLGFVTRLFILLAFNALGGYFFTAHLAATRTARLLHSLAFGWIVVSFTAFLISYFTGWQTNPPTLLLAACLSAVGGAFFSRRVGAPESLRPRRGMPRREIQWLNAEDLAALSLGLVAAFAVALQFDDYLSVRGSCFMQDIAGNSHPFWNRLAGFEIGSSQRLGNPTLVAPFYAMLGMDGFRLFNMFAAFVAGGCLVRLGHALFGGLTYGLSAAAFGLFTPYFLQISTADENIVAMTTCALALYTLLVEPSAVRRHSARGAVWKKHLVLAGLTYGAYVSSRHIQALSIPAVIYYLWRSDFGLPRRIVLRQAAVPFAVISSLIVLLVARHGVPFDQPLFNAPFGVESFSRSPFRALPTAVMLPVYWINQYGSILLAVALIGFIRWLFSRRVQNRFLVAFTLPVYLLLSWMEFFLKPNKNGIPLLLLPVGCLAFGQGLKLLFGPHRRRALAAVGLAVASLLLGVFLVSRLDFSVYPFGTNEKFHQRPKATIEHPYSAYEHAELLTPRLLPNWRQYGRYSSPTAWWKRTPRRPWLHDRWCTLAPLPAQKTLPELPYKLVEIDIDEPFNRYQSWLTPMTGESRLPLLDPYEIPEHFFTLTAAPVWTPDTLHAAVFSCGETLYVIRLFDDIKQPELWGASFEDPGLLIINEGLELLRPFHDERNISWLNSPFAASSDGRLGVPVAGFREIVFFDVLINSQEMAYWWRAILDPDGITTTPPRLFWSP